MTACLVIGAAEAAEPENAGWAAARGDAAADHAIDPPAEWPASLSSLLESSNRVYESTIGSVPGLAFSPVLVEWAMLGDVDHPAVVLFDLMEAELGEGAFVSGRVLDDDRGMLVFEPVGVMVELPGLEASVGEFLPLLGFGPGELTLRRAGLQQGTAMGEAGFVDGVWMLVMEWQSSAINTGGVWMVPIGRADEDEQYVIPDLDVVGWGVIIAAATLGLGLYVFLRELPSCRKSAQSKAMWCESLCLKLKYAHCIELPDGSCSLPLAVRRCLSCCNAVKEDVIEKDCGGPGSLQDWSHIDAQFLECSEDANDLSKSLPGDLWFWREFIRLMEQANSRSLFPSRPAMPSLPTVS